MSLSAEVISHTTRQAVWLITSAERDIRSERHQTTRWERNLRKRQRERNLRKRQRIRKKTLNAPKNTQRCPGEGIQIRSSSCVPSMDTAMDSTSSRDRKVERIRFRLCSNTKKSRRNTFSMTLRVHSASSEREIRRSQTVVRTS